MKMIRNMAFCFGGKFYATQGGPVRLGYSVSEGQLPADWDSKIVTNYPQRLTKETVQFVLIDSDAPGITGSLDDFDADDSDAMCAKPLILYAVIGDETSGNGCDTDGSNLGELFARQANAYVTNAAPSSVTIDGERVETLTVTFRTTTPFTKLTVIPNLTVPVNKDTLANFDDDTAVVNLSALYGVAMPKVVSEADTPTPDPTEAVVAIGVSEGLTFLGLADAEGKIYYTAPVAPSKDYTAAVAKWDRLLPVPLYYLYGASA